METLLAGAVVVVCTAVASVWGLGLLQRVKVNSALTLLADARTMATVDAAVTGGWTVSPPLADKTQSTRCATGAAPQAQCQTWVYEGRLRSNPVKERLAELETDAPPPKNNPPNDYALSIRPAVATHGQPQWSQRWLCGHKPAPDGYQAVGEPVVEGLSAAKGSLPALCRSGS